MNLVTAHGLPELRNKTCDNGALWDALTVMPGITGKPDFDNPDHIRDELGRAQLWWVGIEASELVAAAAPSMPSTTLTRELVADEVGFAYWAKPLIGLSADDPDAGVEVTASQWFPTLIQGRECLSMVTWSGMLGGGYLMPMGRADWPYGDDFDAPIAEVPEMAMASIIEDRRVLAALWVLSSQPSVMDMSLERPGRPERRRLERAGREVPQVRFVHLPMRNQPSPSEGDGATVEWSHRWMVGAHWRQQAYGPGRTLRRPTFIAPYLKGPTDKPFKYTEPVKVWQR